MMDFDKLWDKFMKKKEKEFVKDEDNIDISYAEYMEGYEMAEEECKEFYEFVSTSKTEVKTKESEGE